MKLTTKGRFAVTAMLDIALHDPEEYVSIAAIGDRRHLSSAYLEQIFGKLRRAGLLEGVRGPAGRIPFGQTCGSDHGDRYFGSRGRPSRESQLR